VFRLTRLVLFVAVALVSLSCAAPKGRSSGAVPWSVVRIHAEPGSAAVWINGQLAGRASDWVLGKAMRPGTHRLELRLNGYVSRYIDLRLRAAEEVTLSEILRPEVEPFGGLVPVRH